MRRLPNLPWLRAIAVASIGSTVPAVILDCGSDDVASIPAGDAGPEGAPLASSGTSGSPSGSSTPPTGDGPDSGAPGDADDDGGGDAAPDALTVVPDGGVPPDPGTVTCGGAACTTGESCCVRADGGATCTSGGGACGALGGVRQDCNETSDCPVIDGGQQVCCYERDENSNLLSTSCHANCAGGGGNRVQACRVVGECLTGTCSLHTCAPEAGVPSIESCAPYPSLCP